MSPLDSPHSYLSNSAKSGSFCPFTEISTDLLSPLQIHISYPIWVICLMYIPSIPDVFEKSCRLTLSLRGSCSSRWTGAAQGFCCNGNVTASRTLLGESKSSALLSESSSSWPSKHVIVTIIIIKDYHRRPIEGAEGGRIPVWLWWTGSWLLAARLGIIIYNL